MPRQWLLFATTRFCTTARAAANFSRFIRTLSMSGSSSKSSSAGTMKDLAPPMLPFAWPRRRGNHGLWACRALDDGYMRRTDRTIEDVNLRSDLSLAHLTVLSLPPPEMVRVAARIGYRAVGLRLI